MRNYRHHIQTPKWKGSVDFQLASLFVWIQHTSKPLYTKFGAFRRKWRSLPLFVTLLCYLLHYYVIWTCWYPIHQRNARFVKISKLYTQVRSVTAGGLFSNRQCIGSSIKQPTRIMYFHILSNMFQDRHKFSMIWINQPIRDTCPNTERKKQ